MQTNKRDRRNFLKTVALVSGAAATVSLPFAVQSAEAERLHVAANAYTCNSYYARENKKFMEHLRELKDAGVDGIEPSLGSVAAAETLGKQLRDAGMEMRSVYVGGKFYMDDETAASEQNRLFELAKTVKKYGTKYIISNPDAKSGKTDEEIFRQTAEYEKLGKKLAKLDMKLGIHYHTTEWEFGGREFLHLMSWTDPKFVGLCLETQWSYRACGNSNAAVMAHLKMYAERTIEFHFRQSVNGIWNETFDEGDIDHAFIVNYFKEIVAKTGREMPHVVLEQAAENGTPNTMSAADVFQKSTTYARKLLP